MSTVRSLQKVMEDKSQHAFDERSLKQFEDFYTDMLEKGLVKKQGYELPPLDTIGKRFHDLLASTNNG